MFLKDRADWIRGNYHNMLEDADRRMEFRDALEKGRVQLLGEEVVLHLAASDSTWFRFSGRDSMTIMAPKSHLDSVPVKVVKGALRQLAMLYLEREVGKWSDKTGQEFAKVRVETLEGRWGSCSSGGKGRFDWHLILLPEDLIEYIILHELAHLRFMDHSPEFWAAVGEHCPDHEEKRERLRQSEWLIGILD